MINHVSVSWLRLKFRQLGLKRRSVIPDSIVSDLLKVSLSHFSGLSQCWVDAV